MQFKIRSAKDFYAGLIFVAFGLAAIWGAQAYPMGNAQRMGPGYFPTVLGGLLAVLGLMVLIRSLAVEGPPVDKVHFKPLLLVLGSVVAFGALVGTAGLVVATLVLIVVAALGGHEFNRREVAISSVVLSAATVVVFVYGLKLPFQVWPW